MFHLWNTSLVCHDVSVGAAFTSTDVSRTGIPCTEALTREKRGHDLVSFTLDRETDLTRR